LTGLEGGKVEVLTFLSRKIHAIHPGGGKELLMHQTLYKSTDSPINLHECFDLFIVGVGEGTPLV
jgi:hypothetical protein